MPNFNNLSVYLKINFVVLNISLILGVVGIIGNVLVIMVCAREKLRKYSFSFFCQAKACGDIILLVFVFRNWANFVIGANLDLVTPFFCYIGQFLPYTSGTFSLGILVVISLDRVTTVIYPNRFRWFKKRWCQVGLVLLVAIYSISLNLVLLLNANYVVSKTGVITCSVPAAISTVQTWFRNGLMLAIILIINNFLNAKLIMFIASSRKKVESAVMPRNSTNKDRRMAISAIGLGLVALFCKLPLGIVTITSNYLNLPRDQFIMMFYMAVTVLNVEGSASFFINLFLNSTFNAEFMKMIGVGKRKFSF